MDNLNLIRDITLHYIKYYYNKHLTEHKISKIPDDELTNLVSNLYIDRQKDLKDYIRKNMKENLKDAYNPVITENAIAEMFSDRDFAIQKVVSGIKNYQNQ